MSLCDLSNGVAVLAAVVASTNRHHCLDDITVLMSTDGRNLWKGTSHVVANEFSTMLENVDNYVLPSTSIQETTVVTQTVMNVDYFLSLPEVPPSRVSGSAVCGNRDNQNK